MEFACCRADCALPLWFQMPLSVVVPLEIILLVQQPLSDRSSLWLRVLVARCSRCGCWFHRGLYSRPTSGSARCLVGMKGRHFYIELFKCFCKKKKKKKNEQVLGFMVCGWPHFTRFFIIQSTSTALVGGNPLCKVLSEVVKRRRVLCRVIADFLPAVARLAYECKLTVWTSMFVKMLWGKS